MGAILPLCPLADPSPPFRNAANSPAGISISTTKASSGPALPDRRIS
jgi:hypothetical protein